MNIHDSGISSKLCLDVHNYVTIRADNPNLSVRFESNLLNPGSKTNFNVLNSSSSIKALTYMSPAK